VPSLPDRTDQPGSSHRDLSPNQADRLPTLPYPPALPYRWATASRYVELPGRGPLHVPDVPGPVGAPTVLLLHEWMGTTALNWHWSLDHLRPS
jgi:hypothetical protein